MRHLGVAFFLLGALQAYGAFQVPPLTGPVIDQVGLLHPGEREALENEIRELSETGRVQPEIAILKSLEGDSIESIGIQLADAWKLGAKDKDQGLIIIVAPNEKKMRLEVGRGLEGDIPDAVARRIIGQILAPAFKQGLYANGLEDALSKVAEILFKGQKDVVPEERHDRKIPWAFLIFLLFIGGNFLGPLLGYRRGRTSWFPGLGGWGVGTGLGGGFWGSGGGGGGGWGGGGGGFNGGGSSGSW